MYSNQVINIISNFKAENPNRYGIKKIGVLGSGVQKSSGLTGDVDIVVDLEKPDMFNLIGIKQELEELLDSHVDIVRYRKNMNKYLKSRIDQDAVYIGR
jgi:hypothetical protein